MVSQLRIYTINPGMMESWIKLFKEHIAPLCARLEMPVERAWVNVDQTEFLWVRNFASPDEIPIKEKAYWASPERTALADFPTRHIVKQDVRVVESVATS